MKAGTIIKLSNERIGTVVYNSLDGVGIKWGIYRITMKDIEGRGNLFNNEHHSDNYDLHPDAMLRNPYPGTDLECVGEDYEVIYVPE